MKLSLIKTCSWILVLFLVLTGAPIDGFAQSTGTTPTSQESSDFVRIVITKDDTIDTIADKLVAGGLVKTRTQFLNQWNKNRIKAQTLPIPGAYKFSRKVSTARTVIVLRKTPYMKWVTIAPGLRKEEIGELLARELDWSQAELVKWNTVYTALQYDYREGVYFPDTYLIPSTEKPLAVAKRLISKFNEKFAPYQAEFTEKNISWTKGLTLASLIQREAANTDEMPLIAGIMYNRIEQKIPLGIDATLQYLRGNTGNGWWAPLSKADLELKKSDSKYNTYKYLGTPPTPIGSPSLSAIEAVLDPAKTDCLYYLHDKNQQIHCTQSYEDHLANIEKYLK